MFALTRPTGIVLFDTALHCIDRRLADRVLLADLCFAVIAPCLTRHPEYGEGMVLVGISLHCIDRRHAGMEYYRISALHRSPPC